MGGEIRGGNTETGGFRGYRGKHFVLFEADEGDKGNSFGVADEGALLLGKPTKGKVQEYHMIRLEVIGGRCYPPPK